MEHRRPCVHAGDERPRAVGEVRKFPLGAEAEQALCQRWRDHHDIPAAHQLTGSYLRLVDEIAIGYREYGPASEELIGEGYVGLMHAVCQFDPDRSVRFDMYASWWVRATILEYILCNRSLVKMSTAASWRKLFLSLRDMHRHLRELHDDTLRSKNISGGAADLLRPAEHEVIRANKRRASADRSLNIPISVDDESEWRTWPAYDDADTQKGTLADCEATEHRRSVGPSVPIGITMQERRGPLGTQGRH